MPKQLLFIQGAGEGAHEMDGIIAKDLQESLGGEFDVLYPEMPNEAEPDYEEWKTRIEAYLNQMDDGKILVGHSVGGSILLKYLSEEGISNSISKVLLLAPPYDESVLPEDSSKLEQVVKLFFYHSRDDDIIPFSHVTYYADKLPKATIRKLDGRGHQFQNDLSEVIEDIKG